MNAVVVFLGKDLVEGDPWLAKWLAQGFVHCFVLIEDKDKWVKIEGNHGKMVVTYLGEIGDAEEVADHYDLQGAITVETTVADKPLRSPIVLRTCVGLIKAVLGVRSFALTPLQLYKHLTEN